jgi:UDP-2,3-diacylglucosamine pyrophosphatase LpxH
MTPSTIRCVFASDLHMGHRWSNFHELHAFLKAIDTPEHLYLLGDIVDGWSFPRSWHWTQENNNLVRKVLSLAKHGCQVHYVVGNHDDFLLPFAGHDFGQFRLVREIIHTTADGRRLLVLHGDQFDLIAKAAPILYLLGNWGYALLLRANSLVNAIRRIFRRPQWSLSLWAKRRTKQFSSFLTGFENLVARYAVERHCDGVIAGHTHTPVVKHLGGVVYYNCGDFQEQATVVVEHIDGRLELIDLRAASALAALEPQPATPSVAP